MKSYRKGVDEGIGDRSTKKELTEVGDKGSPIRSTIYDKIRISQAGRDLAVVTLSLLFLALVAYGALSV